MDVIPVLVPAVGGGYLAALGRAPRTAEARRDRRWRMAAFFGALAAIALALGWPIETLAHRFQWAHMTQHLLLVVVAAPLLVLADPWLLPMRLLPRARRGPAAALVRRDPRFATLRRMGRLVLEPVFAFFAFNLVFGIAHVPVVYDLTLRIPWLHEMEHALFLGTAALLWWTMIGRQARSIQERLICIMAAGFAASLLALWLASSETPLYHGFTGTSTLSPLTDQRLSAGIMGGPGSIVLALAAGILLYHWLRDQEGAETGVGGGSS
jgi:putative membrane protein